MKFDFALQQRNTGNTPNDEINTKRYSDTDVENPVFFNADLKVIFQQFLIFLGFTKRIFKKANKTDLFYIQSVLSRVQSN